MSFKEYGSKVIGAAAISYAQATGSGTDIHFVGTGNVETVSVPLATVASDLGLSSELALTGSINVALNKDAVGSVEVSAGKTQVRFAGGTYINLVASYADAKAALGL